MARGAPLVGRRHQLDRVTRLITRSVDPAVLLISGDAGVGKSRLAAAATAAAAESGVHVLAGWCLKLSQDLPLLPVLDVLRCMSDLDAGSALKAAAADCPAFVEEELIKLLPELGDGSTAPAGSATESGAHRQRVFEALRRILAAFGRPRSAAVVIEDLHWADNTTLELLDYLMSPSHHPELPLVLTYRSGDQIRTDVSDLLERMRRNANVQHLDLPPLTRDETTEQIALLLGNHPPGAFADAIFARSEGNAFFTEQLVSYSPSRDGSGLPAGLASLLLSRTSQVSAAARAVLNALTVAGRGLDEQALVVVCERPAAEVRQSLRELTELRLLQRPDASGQYRLRHALLAEALAGTVLPGEARELHGRIGGVMTAREDRSFAAEVADHLQAAGVFHREFALRCDAARYAEDAAAPDQAAMQWQRVLELWELVPNPEQQSALDLVDVYDRAERALESAGSRDAAYALATQALARLEGEASEAEAVRLYSAVGQYGTSFPAEQFAAARRAVEIGTGLPPTGDYVRALNRYADLLADQGRWEERNQTWLRALDVATRAGLHAEQRLIQADMIWLAFHADDAAGVERGIDAVLATQPEPHRVLDDARVLVRLTSMLLLLAQRDRVIDLSMPAIGRFEAAGHGETRWVQALRANTADALLESGDVSRAAMLLDPFAGSQPTTESIDPHLMLARLNVYRGRLDEVGTFWVEAADLGEPGHAYDNSYNFARGRLEFHFWRGDPLACVTNALELLEVPNARGNLHLWGDLFVDVLSALAEGTQDARLTPDSATRADLADMYRRLITAKQAAPRDPFYPTACSPRAAANGATWEAELSRFEGSADPEAWDLAASSWANLGCRFAAAYARWRHAEALLAIRGRRAEATPVLRTASVEAAQHVPLSSAISALARRARIDLTPAAAAPTRESALPWGLTDREHEVLKLVGQGLSNNEIGRALFISGKTVSVHVSSIMRKIGVTTRVQAAAAAARSGILDAPD